MSIRPDNVRREANSFSLTDYLGASTQAQPHLAHRAQAPPVATAAPQQQRSSGGLVFQLGRTATPGVAPGTATTGVSQGELIPPGTLTASKLTFNLSNIQPGAARPGAVPTSHSSPASTAPMPNLTFALHSMRASPMSSALATGAARSMGGLGNKGHSGPASTENPTPSTALISMAAQRVGDPGAEVMRLTALLDESKMKLSRTTARLSATEASVARANQSLTSERAAAAARVVQMTNELRASREIEVKLRSEIANSPAKADFARREEAFRIQAVGAIQLEQAHAELQGKLEQTQQLHVQANEALRHLRDEHAALVSEHERVCTELETAKARIESIEQAPESPKQPVETSTASLVATDDAVDSIVDATEKLRLEMHDQQVLAVQRAVQDAAMLHAEKVVELEHKQSLLEDLLMQAGSDTTNALRARDDALELLAAAKAGAAAAPSEALAEPTVEPTAEPTVEAVSAVDSANKGAEPTLSAESTELLQQYTELHARFQQLEKVASSEVDHQLELESTRHKVQSLYNRIATGVASDSAPVVRTRSNAELIAAARDNHARNYLDSVLPARFEPLNAAATLHSSPMQSHFLSPTPPSLPLGCYAHAQTGHDTDAYSESDEEEEGEEAMEAATSPAKGAAEYATYEMVLYRNQEDKLVPARIVAVHRETETPYYTIMCDGTERQTEGTRLQATGNHETAKEQQDYNLKDKKQRVKAMIVNISEDLKYLFKVKEKRYDAASKMHIG